MADRRLPAVLRRVAFPKRHQGEWFVARGIPVDAGLVDADVVADHHEPTVRGNAGERGKRIDCSLNAPSRAEVVVHLFLHGGADLRQVAERDELRFTNKNDSPCVHRASLGRKE
jgi:hypothetical protein